MGSEGLSVEGVNELPFLMPGRIGTVRFDVSIVFYVAIYRAFFLASEGLMSSLTASSLQFSFW